MTNGKRSRVDWRGYLPAITTPFTDDFAFDEKGLGGLLEWLHAEGMHGLVLGGTTGEWTSMTPAERVRLFKLAAAQLKGKLPLIGGCSAFTPTESIALIAKAEEVKLDGVLITPPPYIRPNADEIFGFYAAIAAESRLPICVYNWPPGTGIDMPLELLTRLAGLDAVVAIKQSTSSFARFAETFFALNDQVRVFGFPMDELGLGMLRLHGGDGTMGAGGVLGRVQPGFYDNLWAGDIEAARECGRKDRVLMAEWYTPELVGRFGSGPAILKAALDVQGVPGGSVRPPLHNVGGEGREMIATTLRNLNII
ncbi:MAG: dihydrodipicolinate synthase family protein [Sphingomonadales bacterium]|nr:MAG: dihydrodipicolinate synthase family protein [Sphingomonadales bacterium]